MSDAPRLSEVRGSGSSTGVGVLGAVLVAGAGLCGIGVTAAIAIPNFEAAQQKARRSEVPSNVDSIRTAELAQFALFGRYLPAGDPVAAAAELAGGAGKQQRPWVGGSDWDQLRWRPDYDARGVYWVEVSDTGFRVVGLCDVDGDGVHARYEADATHNATLMTDPQTY